MSIHTIAIRSVVLGASCFVLLQSGCAGNRDHARTSFQAELDALSRDLDESTRALDVTETLNMQLEATNEELHAQLVRLENEKKQELEKLQAMRDQDSAVSSRRIRDLNTQI